MPLPTISNYPLPTLDTVPMARVAWDLDPARAAILVHDMQHYFLRMYGDGQAPLEPAIRAIEKIRDAAAKTNVPVLFSVQPGEQTMEERGLLRDMWGEGIVRHPELQTIALQPPREKDIVVYKHRYSAFFDTALADEMQARGRDQLIITGVYAHIGCLATAVDAFMRGIQPFFVADATADFSREDHDIALRQVARTCGVVTSSAAIVESLEGLPA